MTRVLLILLLMVFGTVSAMSAPRVIISGDQLNAAAAALPLFIQRSDKSTLEDYEIEVQEAGDSFEVIFVPRHLQGALTMRGGGTEAGQEVHYIVEKRTFKIIRVFGAR